MHLTLCIITNLYLCFFLLGRFSFGDPKLKMWIDFNSEFVQLFGNGLPADFVPILKYFPDQKTKKCVALIQRFLDEIALEMKAHRETFDPGKCKVLLKSIYLIYVCLFKGILTDFK